MTDSFYELFAAQKCRLRLFFKPRYLNESQGSTQSWARCTGSAHLPQRRPRLRARSAAGPAVRMRGHAALQTDGARDCALPSASARPVTPAPAPRLPVQTLTLSSGPSEARAAYSLPLSTGDPPAVKHGAAPAAKRLRQNLGPKYDRQPLPPPLQTFGFVEPSGVAASPFLFRTRPRPLGGGWEAPWPLRALSPPRPRPRAAPSGRHPPGVHRGGGEAAAMLR